MEHNSQAWFVRIEVDSVLAAELATDNAWVLGAAGVEERSDDPEGPIVLLAAFLVEDAARLAAAQLAPRWPGAQAVSVDDDDWREIWRSYARPVRAGNRFLVCPAWLARPDDDRRADGTDADLVIWMDSASTFGSGSHPSTRLALALLEQAVHPGATVLDVGCGSGVLAIGAALLGATGIRAIDVDPDAPGVTRANAGANSVATVITATNEPLGVVEGQFDVVIANIDAPVLEELAGELVGHLAPSGALVLSGLLDARSASLLAAFPGLVVRRHISEEGWSGLLLARPDA